MFVFLDLMLSFINDCVANVKLFTSAGRHGNKARRLLPSNDIPVRAPKRARRDSGPPEATPVKTEEDIERQVKIDRLLERRRALDAEIRELGQVVEARQLFNAFPHTIVDIRLIPWQGDEVKPIIVLD